MPKPLKLRALEGDLMPEEETYQARLRQAMFNGLSESDVTEVVKQITAKAKAGDPQAVKLFFDYVLGAKAKPTVVNVTNNFASVEDAAEDAKKRKAV